MTGAERRGIRRQTSSKQRMRSEPPDGTRSGTIRRIPHEPVISIISSGIEYEMTRQQRRRRNPARSEAPARRPTRKSERAIARERHVHDGKQADRPAARNRKSASARASHDPEGGGLNQASRPMRAGERGQGERKKMMKGHGEHEYLIISSPALLTSSKHRITHQPAAPSKENARRPVAIPSPSRRHHIMGQAAATAISHRSRSRPRRHLITPKAWPRQRRSHDITRQASSPVGSPSPDTTSGAMSETTRGDER